MKFLYIFLVFLLFSKFLNAQINPKINIDYQYYRDMDNYYAFEIFKDKIAKPNNEIKLNFSWKGAVDNLKQIIIKIDDKEEKLDFKLRSDLVENDNKELNNVGVNVNLSKLYKNESCNSQLVFTLRSGIKFTLPFNICQFKTAIKN
jgi:hypothetical protein